MRRNIKSRTVFLFCKRKRSSGFTIIELLVAMVILAILAAIAFSVYNIYLNKAKIAIAESTLDIARDNLELYNIDNGKYPGSISFTNCVDENGGTVFSPAFCDQLAKDLTPESYTLDNGNYHFKARAKDSNKTLITLTKTHITK